MSAETNAGYLPPQEQLVIGAKVNRICEIEPGEPHPFPMITDAQDVVKALDPRLKFSRSRWFKRTSRRSREATIAVGATQSGSVSVSFDSTEVKEQKFGIEEYRIGGHIAIKQAVKGGPASMISMAPFWGAGGANLALEQFPDQTSIVYLTKNQFVYAIIRYHIYPEEITLFGQRVIRLRSEPEMIWEHQYPPKSKKRGKFRDKRLLYKNSTVGKFTQ